MTVIHPLKAKLHNKFNLKDLRNLKYFLGLEINHSKDEINLSQCHYTLQLLEDTGFFAYIPSKILMDHRNKLNDINGEPISDPAQYRR